MPTICTFRGIKVFMNYADHMPPHFHAVYAGAEAFVDIRTLEAISTDFPSRQLKMVIGWAACHQQELLENWELAQAKEELFQIMPTLL